MENGFDSSKESVKRILFVCTGNTCRSVMAEHIARRRFQNRIEVRSAGTNPGSIADASNAIYTLQQVGIDASSHEPRDVREMALADFDLVVAMDKHVGRELKQLFPDLVDARLVMWRIGDPYGDNLEEYDRCAKMIYRELKKLFSRVGTQV